MGLRGERRSALAEPGERGSHLSPLSPRMLSSPGNSPPWALLARLCTWVGALCLGAQHGRWGLSCSAREPHPALRLGGEFGERASNPLGPGAY